MNYAEKDGFIWLDGEFYDWRDAKVHVLTNTLHYGVGVFEGIRAYHSEKGTAIFRLDDHIKRLFNSAKLVHLGVNYDYDTIVDMCSEAIRKNELQEAYIRPMVFFGSEGMGLHAENLLPHTMIAAWEWGAYLGKDGLTKGIKIKTSTYRRNHINSLHSQAKVNGHYVNSILALREAKQCGYHEALMLDHLGFIAEGSGENFFMIKGGELITPFTHASLAGITRDTIMKLAGDFDIPVREANIPLDEAYLADEVFFTGTAAEVTPICQLDGHIIGNGEIGPITKQLQSAYFDLVKGKNSKYESWLTYV